MKLSQLKKITTRSKKRLGRGHGSGKVKTSGRGTKGQKARGKIPVGFEGGQLPLIKRLPLLRGKGKNASRKAKAFAVNVGRLDLLPAKSVITVEALRKQGLIGDVTKVKIVGNTKLSNAYTVKVSSSQAAKSAIEKAGGKVEN